MPKQKIIMTLLVSYILSLNAWAADAGQQATDQTLTPITITRGQSISLDTLSTIADASSAQDQQGNPIQLTDKTYTVGSFNKTTITIVPPNGGADDVITLNLVNH